MLTASQTQTLVSVPLPVLAALLLAAQAVPQAAPVLPGQPLQPAISAPFNPMTALQNPIVVPPQAMAPALAQPAATAAPVETPAKPGWVSRCLSAFGKASAGAVIGACAQKAFEAVSPVVMPVLTTCARIAMRACGL